MKLQPGNNSIAITTLALLAAAASAAPVDFVRDVRPIFEKHCYVCHGPNKQRSGFRLDVKSEALKGGDTYQPAILPGKSADSPLLKLITATDKTLLMPPKGDRLSPMEVATLKAWIDEGAVWPEGVDRVKLHDKRDHWAFKPLTRPTPPAPMDTTWARNDVDRFILARLEKEKLKPAPPTERAAWLRRVSFDLTGLPPTPEQVAAFQKDTRDNAYETVVDALLKSPRYGERWAQHWLDVVRYADTHGFEVNTERPNAWPYRDYVIEAFNDDVPYDRFIREQLVGEGTRKEPATGFLVTASVLLPGQIGADPASKRLARQDAIDEIVINIGQTFLGLSVGCARCHDHKFDPISQVEYFGMQAFVAGIEYGERDLHTPEADSARAEERRLRAELDHIDNTLKRLAVLAKSGDLGKNDAAESTRLTAQKKKVEASIKSVSRSAKVFAGVPRTPDVIKLLYRGDPEQPKEDVAPIVPAALGSMKLAKDAPELDRRKALAEWIASPHNPLTARVMVNRIWQGHFGTGLVETPSDFGNSGAKPSHPELLDWLASEFIRSDWSVKHMHRLMVLSATYRQSSRIDPAAAAKDADTRLLWRYPARRLDGEAIRDAMLSVSGRLNLKTGGPGFNLFDKRGGLTGFTPIESFTDAGRRRMIYAHRVRREKDAVFGSLDCPDNGQSTARRRESTTPLQALSLFNSRFTLDESEALAARVRKESSTDVPEQMRRVYQLTLSREPTSEEMRDAEPLVREHGLSLLCRVLFNSNEFLFLP